jgi:hypothetical protein
VGSGTQPAVPTQGGATLGPTCCRGASMRPGARITPGDISRLGVEMQGGPRSANLLCEEPWGVLGSSPAKVPPSVQISQFLDMFCV